MAIFLTTALRYLGFLAFGGIWIFTISVIMARLHGSDIAIAAACFVSATYTAFANRYAKYLLIGIPETASDGLFVLFSVVGLGFVVHSFLFLKSG
jgi:hypothetical protein